MADRVVWLDRGWQPVLFGFCPSEKAWKREMNRLGSADLPYPSSGGSCSRFKATETSSECILVTIRDGEEKRRSLEEIVGILVHEATHVWQFILEHIGEDKASPEMEAYALQAISQGLFAAFVKTRGMPNDIDR